MPNNYWDTLDIDGDERPIADATARLSLEGKMNKVNPTGTGALSINREDNTTVGDYSAAEGYSCEASGEASHGEGSLTKAQGDGAHSEGVLTQATGNGSHAEGYASQSSDDYSHAEGQETLASGTAAHAEGYNTEASDDYSHAEGNSSVASGKESHAEGMNCIASGDNSHAEGLSSISSGLHSHAEGSGNTASGLAAHAEGRATQASGASSHAEGQETLASSANQHVSGKYNIEDNQDTYAEIVGNGTADNARSNGRTLDWQGNERLAGGLTINAGTASETDIGTALGDKVDKEQGKGLSTEDYTTAEKTKLAGLPSTVPSDADDIAYDNTTSGATATNAQDAIDEAFSAIAAKVDTNREIKSDGTSILAADNFNPLNLYARAGITLLPTVGPSQTGLGIGNSYMYPTGWGYKDDFSDKMGLSSSGNWSRMGSFDISAGVWLISVALQFPQDPTGIRGVGLYTGTSSTPPTDVSGIRFQNTVQAVNGAATNIVLTCPIQVTTSRTIYIMGRQTSGASMDNIKVRASWIKLMPI